MQIHRGLIHKKPFLTPWSAAVTFAVRIAGNIPVADPRRPRAVGLHDLKDCFKIVFFYKTKFEFPRKGLRSLTKLLCLCCELTRQKPQQLKGNGIPEFWHSFPWNKLTDIWWVNNIAALVSSECIMLKAWTKQQQEGWMRNYEVFRVLSCVYQSGIPSSCGTDCPWLLRKQNYCLPTEIKLCRSRTGTVPSKSACVQVTKQSWPSDRDKLAVGWNLGRIGTRSSRMAVLQSIRCSVFSSS